MPEGVLSDRELRVAVRDGWIAAADGIDDRQFQPASLDLRLGPQAYQLRASFLPFRETVQGRLGDRGVADSDLVIDQLTLTGAGATLQRGSVYLIPLLESLALPEDVRGRSNPKSTTGRLDIFTRVITDATPRFDEIRGIQRSSSSPDESQAANLLGAETYPIERQTHVESRRAQCCFTLCARDRGHCQIGVFCLTRLTVHGESEAAISRGFDACPLKCPNNAE